MGPFQGETGVLMVELRDFVSLGIVTVPAVLMGKLLPVGSVVLMARRTKARPTGLFQAQVIESVHGEGGRRMAEVTALNGKRAVVWIVGFVANGTSVGIMETELEPSLVSGSHLMTLRARGDGMSSIEVEGCFLPMSVPVEGG